eukprot:771815-Rhodomonas_salina.3
MSDQDNVSETTFEAYLAFSFDRPDLLHLVRSYRHGIDRHVAQPTRAVHIPVRWVKSVIATVSGFENASDPKCLVSATVEVFTNLSVNPMRSNVPRIASMVAFSFTCIGHCGGASLAGPRSAAGRRDPFGLFLPARDGSWVRG